MAGLSLAPRLGSSPLRVHVRLPVPGPLSSTPIRALFTSVGLMSSLMVTVTSEMTGTRRTTTTMTTGSEASSELTSSVQTTSVSQKLVVRSQPVLKVNRKSSPSLHHRSMILSRWVPCNRFWLNLDTSHHLILKDDTVIMDTRLFT